MNQERVTFGREVLGPIFADYALRLWIYLTSLAHPQDTSLLFCARGGLRLHLLFNRFITATKLEMPVSSADLMVSRVVAVRSALLAEADCAYQQVGYEFSDDLMHDVAEALGSAERPELSGAPLGSQRYSRQGLRDLLASAAGRPLRQEIEEQDRLFQSHLSMCRSGRGRVILCDTGLFGSTVQLLAAGMPELSWSSVLVARSNYKRLATPHFPRTLGLLVEADQYCPWQARTTLLRYWQLVEAVFEPDLASVKRFTQIDGKVTSNLECPGWQARVAAEPDSIFAGVVDYVDSLEPGAPARIVHDVRKAWTRLRRAIVWPRDSDSRMLEMGPRSDDFGLDTVSRPRKVSGPLAALRGRSMWREGEIASATSLLRAPLLAGIEAAYVLRWCRRSMAPNRSREFG